MSKALTPKPDEPTQMLQGWLERVYQRRLTNKYDAMTLVVGNEGVGKSTLILELLSRYLQLRNVEPDEPIKAVLDRVVWSTRDEFQDYIADANTRSAVAVPDAARVLHKKEAMVGDQREIEKDLLDVRAKEFLFLLGYQDWSVIPSILQERRAHFVLRIPNRGVVEGYGRGKIDEKVDMERDEWPEPDFEDTFPDLAKTAPELWSAYEQTDIEKKNERMAADSDPKPGEAKKDAQRRTALRAVARGMAQEEAASMTDYSRGWVGQQVRAYRREEIDPFANTDEDGPPPSAV